MTKLHSLPLASRFDDLITHLRTPLYRNGYALIISTGITSVLGLVYWAVAARVFATEEVGLNSMAISVMIFLSGVAQLNLQEMLIRFVPRAGARTLRLVLNAYGIVIGLSLLVGVIFCLGIPLWAPSLSFLITSPVSILWFALAMVLWGVFVLEDSLLMGLRRALYIPVENAIFAVLKIASLLLLAALLPTTGIFISWTVSVILVIVPVNWLIFRRLIPQHVENAQSLSQTVHVREITNYVAANYVSALLSSLSSAALPLIITQIAGATANAHFYLAWIVASSLQVIAANMSTSLTVEATLATDDQEAYRRRALIGIARIVLPLVAVIVVGAPLILRLMGPSYVEEGTVLLQLLALAAIPNLFNMVYVGMARARSQVKGVIAVYGANALMVLALSFILLQIYGIAGVGLAWLISQSLIAGVLLFQSKMSARRPQAVVAPAAEGD